MIAQLLGLLCATGFLGCTTPNPANSQSVATHWQRLIEQVESKTTSAAEFGHAGPFETREVLDYQVPLTPSDKVVVDLFTPVIVDSGPLILMVHGNKFNKLVHGSQCRHLASWGFHCAAVEVPNEGQWLSNGRRVEKLVRIIHSFPSLLSDKIDVNRIILAGHSFGGSAVTIAAGRKAPIAGLILLDPAVVHPTVQNYMENVTTPVILLGADPGVFTSRKRKLFYRNISGPMSEVSITGATHNDAQMPSISQVGWGFDMTTTARYQEVFLQTIVASAFSIGGFNNVQFAWKAFEPFLKVGLLKSGKKRSAKNQMDHFNR